MICNCDTCNRGGQCDAHREMAGTPQEMSAQLHAMHLALRNVSGLAQRIKRRGHGAPTDADHLIRFCREAGVEPTILRGKAVVPPRLPKADRPIPFIPTDLRGTAVEPAPTDPNRPRAKR